MSAEENLKKNNIILPKAADPVGAYVATKKAGNFLFVSGQISMNENGELIKGKVGKDLNVEEGYNADLLIWNLDSLEGIPYSFDSVDNNILNVIKNGDVV